MIRYSLSKINKACNYDKVAVVQYFYLTQFIKYPFSTPIGKKIIKEAERGIIRGDSYLLNVDDLLYNEPRATQIEIYDYIELASARNYMDYKATKQKGLNLQVVESLNVNYKGNSLLYIDEKRQTLHFKYE